MTDELHRYKLTVDGKDIEGLRSISSDDLPPVAEIGSKVRGHLKEMVELKHDQTREHSHSEQRAFYEWVKEVSVPVEPYTFDVYDETQGPDWLVVYTKSHFTGMTRAPNGDLSIGMAMEAQQVWLRCPHGMISDDETEAMWLAERALREPSLRVER